MPQSLLALDTDHIKRYVFGTSRLKEIRGASSLLDGLNRVEMVALAENRFGAHTIFARGGSALFLLDSSKAEPLGKAIQQLYHEKTAGGASITYAIQPIPDSDDDAQTLLTATGVNENVTMQQVLKVLRVRLNLAKDSLQQYQPPWNLSEQEREQPREAAVLALPSYVLLSPCQSCGIAYATGTWRDLAEPDDPEDPDEPESDETEGLYCQVCLNKRSEDRRVKKKLYKAPLKALQDEALWGSILQALMHPRDSTAQPYALPRRIRRPKDFNAFSEFTRGKDYLGLVYADANGMGQALDTIKTLAKVEEFSKDIDEAVFQAMGDAIRRHLPAQKERLPFDLLLVGGDDIVMVTPAAQALQVACTLAERFQFHTKGQYTLSVGVVLAPVKYPFSLQRLLADDILKAAKKSGAENKANKANKAVEVVDAEKRTGEDGEPEQPHVNFVVVMGNTSLSYTKIYERMHQRKLNQEEYYATLRPYPLAELEKLLDQLQVGKQLQLGRTKLHQLREAILKIDRSTSATILEALALLRNWRKQEEREFIKALVTAYDERVTPLQERKGTLFPWGLDGSRSTDEYLIYRTPLLDFIELYDFVP